VADELPQPGTAPPPDDRRRRTPAPKITYRERPASPYVPGSTVKRPPLTPPAGPRFRDRPRPPVVRTQPVAAPARKPKRKARAKPPGFKSRINPLLRSAGRTAASWTPKVLTAARFFLPQLELVSNILVRSVASGYQRARHQEYSDIDLAAFRWLRSVEPYRGPSRRSVARSPLVNPVKATAPRVLSRPAAAVKPAPQPKIQPPPTAPRLRPPVSRPRAPPRKVTPPRPAGRPFRLPNPFSNPFLAPQLAPQLDPLTRFETLGVPLPKPRTRPQPNPSTQPRRQRCACPKPKKPKKGRPGRGFFTVTRTGKETRKYWKTGKYHDKEYRDASYSG